MSNTNEKIDYHWHNNFFKRHPEVQSKYKRCIDRQRIKAEDPDEFIDWFRRFHNVRAKWGIIDPDIYNMDESGCAIGLE